MLDLKLIDPHKMTGDEVESLWSDIRDQEDFFDDAHRGRPDLFVTELFKPGNMYLRIGDCGLLAIKDIIQGHNAEIHFVFWEKPPIMELYHASREMMKDLFHGRLKLKRLTVYIPTSNKQVQHFASMLGFSPEGCLRKYLLRGGQSEDLLFYGLLREEFDSTGEVQ